MKILTSEYFSHPLLREHTLLFRKYQHDIQKKLNYKNSLVVLPTSLGKTIVTLLVCLDILYNWKKSKILILAPTRPLVHQHLELFKKYTIFPHQCFALTGKLSPKIRESLWNSHSIRVYFATPELVRNDLNNNRLKKNDFYLIVFDEAHRAVKEYSYTFISKKFYENPDGTSKPLILALSASPGSNKETINEICSNLFIEQIAVKSEKDDDVLPYIYHVDIQQRIVELNDYYKAISRILNSLVEEKIDWLIKNKFIRKKKIDNVYRKDLLSLGDFIRSNLDDKNINSLLLAALKYQSMSMILLYCRDLVESQGIFALKSFFKRIDDEPSTKTYQELLTDSRIQKIMSILQNTASDSILNHPKLEKLVSITSQFLTCDNSNQYHHENSVYAVENTCSSNIKNDYPLEHGYHQKKILIFSQYRDTVEEIICRLQDNGISCRGFYGQSNRNGQKGLSQDKQLSILDDFKQGLFPVLVATSVAEEGLDIPNVELVLFYEPVPSAIRFIQRKGRTGRFSNGKVIVLITKDSVDSKYFEISKRKIDKMKHDLIETNFVLDKYIKRSFEHFDRMDDFEIKSLNTKFISNPYGQISNPILDSISSNSNRRIKYIIKKLSYQRINNVDNNGSPSSSSWHISNDNMKDLYEVSLNLDKKMITGRAQRQIRDLLAKAGSKGIEIAYLKEIVNFDDDVIEEAIKNLERKKHIVWINNRSIQLLESVKFIPGKKYVVYVENVLRGKAIIRVNDKWLASLEPSDYYGPRTLLKKGISFNVIGEMYRKNGRLHMVIRKIT